MPVGIMKCSNINPCNVYKVSYKLMSWTHNNVTELIYANSQVNGHSN